MACLCSLVSTPHVLLVNQSRARLRSAPLHLLIGATAEIATWPNEGARVDPIRRGVLVRRVRHCSQRQFQHSSADLVHYPEAENVRDLIPHAKLGLQLEHGLNGLSVETPVVHLDSHVVLHFPVNGHRMKKEAAHSASPMISGNSKQSHDACKFNSAFSTEKYRPTSGLEQHHEFGPCIGKDRLSHSTPPNHLRPPLDCNRHPDSLLVRETRVDQARLF
jgi:hypothetical protein